MALRCTLQAISIHALREEGDLPAFLLYHTPMAISIHALREEGDVLFEISMAVRVTFLSTPSARRATRRLWQSNISVAYFYPRPPRGGRRADAPGA